MDLNCPFPDTAVPHALTSFRQHLLPSTLSLGDWWGAAWVKKEGNGDGGVTDEDMHHTCKLLRATDIDNLSLSLLGLTDHLATSK